MQIEYNIRKWFLDIVKQSEQGNSGSNPGEFKYGKISCEQSKQQESR